MFSSQEAGRVQFHDENKQGEDQGEKAGVSAATQAAFKVSVPIQNIFFVRFYLSYWEAWKD